MSTVLWHPTAERIAAANMTVFQHAFAPPSVRDFASLYDWSIDRPEEFWPAVWEFGEIIAHRRWDEVLVDKGRMPGAKWFPGSRLNFAENLLRFHEHTPQREALVYWNESGRHRSLTFKQLYAEVARFAAALKDAGIREGDRVAAIVPNIPEAVIAMLATASIGAIWSSCSPDFGAEAIVDRFGQIEPRILITVDGYVHAGKSYDCIAKSATAAMQISSSNRTIVIPNLSTTPDVSRLPHAMLWKDFVHSAASGPIEFAQLPFDHPLYILFSSGTTGAPKCVIHSAGGTLLQHVKELALHTDIKPGDRIFYYTTCGWMMWNWMVSSLALGATVVVYEGSPFHPQPDILFQLAERERLTVFGVTARYLAAAEKMGLKPGANHSLTSIRTILSTGSPLPPESYDYVYAKIKGDVLLASIAGGTDIVSCFALGNPAGAVHRGELQTRGLGMKVEVFDDSGTKVTGQKGELVCTAPFPSMPIGFWNDPKGERYRAAYFEVYPGVWRHGDYVEQTATGGMIFHGRSDAVLKPGGVRIGTSEIYRPVERMPEVLECVATGQQWDNDVRVILFVKLRPGFEATEGLEERICSAIRDEASPRHVPSKVIFVHDIPRTKSGKICEIAVRDVIHGRQVKNRDALANPESLDEYRNRVELSA